MCQGGGRHRGVEVGLGEQFLAVRRHRDGSDEGGRFRASNGRQGVQEVYLVEFRFGVVIHVDENRLHTGDIADQ